jgi:hypothetical protein
MVDAYILDYIIIGKTKNVSMRQVADIGKSRYESESKSFFMSETDDVEELREIPENDLV